MINALYDDILRMVLKQIRYDSATSFSNFSYNNLIPSGVMVEPSTDDGVSLTNPYDVVKLENYDYHLNYDSEDLLASFTSNNGLWNWALCADSFGDLTHVRVFNPYIPFIIALIWQNYDMRRPDPETEDKGNLTDIVLLGLDRKPLITGLTIVPSSVSCMPGESVHFDAQVKLPDGDTLTVTDDAEWIIVDGPPEMTIANGDVSNAVTGRWTISASIQGLQATAQLVVETVSLSLNPVSYEAEPNSNVQFTPFLQKGNSLIQLPWTSCTWSITADNGTDPLPTITNGLVTNTSYPGGIYTVTATYQGNTATASLYIIMPLLMVDPSAKEISQGETSQFSALLKIGNKLSTVTDQCSWAISPAGPIVDNSANKGLVSNTGTAQGSYDVTASYSPYNIDGSGTLKVVDSNLWIEPSSKKVDLNETAQYRAYYKDAQGFQSDVTNLCVWNIESPCTISKGFVSHTTLNGTFGISATFGGKTASATITVVAPRLELRPDDITIKVGQEALYKAYYITKNGEADVSDVVKWSMSATTFIMSRGRVYNCFTAGTYNIRAIYVVGSIVYNADATLTVQDITLTVDPASQTSDLGSTATVRSLCDGVDVTTDTKTTWKRNGNSITGFDGHVVVNEAGPIYMEATYMGKVATGVITVRQRQLVIVPGSYSISIGETRTFKAYLRADGVADIDVTNQCNWTADSPLTISQSGQVGNTVSVGSFNVTATYRLVPTLTANATVIIAENTFNVHDYNITLQVRDNSDIDGDALTIWVNGELKLNDYTLTSAWKDIPCTLLSGSNIIKIGATGNGRIWYYDGVHGPMYGAGMVTASVRGLKTGTTTVVIPETVLNIDAPKKGEERLNLDPNTYYKIWGVNLT